ncbi:uncharacterized protein DDB_G0292186-like isoform X2 [Aphis gossypii]|uniref:uncharacterized protein DDB_G0292186-like isoform X2 n=1 Tax=Aphis gossypii TaxID=80765 RepID=UPI00215949EA|nr:uncharacterized protein DDB_G0292186-like isoform X2 [Aphis gossypii]
MSYKNRKLNNRAMSDDESVSDSDYLTSVLNMVNGYYKMNLVVPQTNLFYSSNSLLPINAKVNSTTLNNKNLNSQVINSPNSLSNMLKNIDLKSDKNMDDKRFQSPNKPYADEIQVYSKPSYSDNSNLLGKTEENKNGSSEDQNCSNEYFNQFENEVLADGRMKQDQELRKKQIKSIKNNISNNGVQTRSRATHSQQNPENEITNKNVPLQSECPLCFVLYPTPDIEAHASECSI